MRKITLGPIVVFSLLLAASLVIAFGMTRVLFIVVPSGPFTGVGCIAAFVVSLYAGLILLNRLFLRFRPLSTGELAEGSPEEFSYNVNLLFYLLFFYPLIRCTSVPVPLMRIIYLLLGAKLGSNTYSSGCILDPSLTTVGSNTIIGLDAIISCHTVEGSRISLASVRIGSNVTVGGHTIVLPGSVIGDGAVVGVSSVVSRGTVIGPGQTWAGAPARKIRDALEHRG